MVGCPGAAHTLHTGPAVTARRWSPGTLGALYHGKIPDNSLVRSIPNIGAVTNAGWLHLHLCVAAAAVWWCTHKYVDGGLMKLMSVCIIFCLTCHIQSLTPTCPCSKIHSTYNWSRVLWPPFITRLNMKVFCILIEFIINLYDWDKKYNFLIDIVFHHNLNYTSSHNSKMGAM